MLLTMVLLLSLDAAATENRWAQTYEITGTPELRIETTDANIRVETWEKSAIEILVLPRRIKIGEGGLRIEDRQDGDTVEIDVRFPRFQPFPGRVDIEVRVPRRADLVLHTRDGTIDVEGTAGDLTVSTGDGDIGLRRVEGSVWVKAGDGDVQVSGTFRNLEIKTGDGEIDATALDGSRMASPWSLRTGDGHLTLGLPEDFAAEVDLHTGDGNIDLGLPLTVSGRATDHGFRGTLNGGGELLTLRSGDGSIRMESVP